MSQRIVYISECSRFLEAHIHVHVSMVLLSRQGQPESSPAFQRRGRVQQRLVPSGRLTEPRLWGQNAF